jgi:hypothetical protein
LSLRGGQTKSVAGPMGGTAGPTTGTVQGSTKENYLPRSHEKDRDTSIEHSNGLTTGTHIIYQRGTGASWGWKAARQQAVAASLEGVAIPNDL